MTVPQWSTTGSSSSSSIASTSNGKKRLMAGCHLKRDRMQMGEGEDDTQGMAKGEYAEHLGKRFRIDPHQIHAGSLSAAAFLRHAVTDKALSQYSSEQILPRLDEEQQRTRFDSLGADLKDHREHLCSLWMNIQGDVEMRDDVADTSSSSSSSSSGHYDVEHVFELRVSTPTGHPHPYNLNKPSSSRIKLDDGYFHL